MILFIRHAYVCDQIKSKDKKWYEARAVGCCVHIISGKVHTS